MKTRRAKSARATHRKPTIRKLKARVQAARTELFYAVPYYTRDGTDTEYLISNPGVSPVQVRVGIVGKQCRLVKVQNLRLGPHCTQSIRVRVHAPENAGHSVVISTAPVIIHLLYLRSGDLAVTGGELAGRDNVIHPNVKERSRTYGFGYRALPLGRDPLAGAVFISNPHDGAMTGQVVFHDQKCRTAAAKKFRIKPHCTTECAFPQKRFGYGCIVTSQQPVVNVLHFAAKTRIVAAAELIGEADRIGFPCDGLGKRSKILFDDTHGCRPGVTGDWTLYEAALAAAGYSVTHYTSATVTLAALRRYDVFVITIARQNYTAAEKRAIVDFVNEGGGVLIVQDFGNAPWSSPTREVLNLFGANDDNNIVVDPTNCYTPNQTDDVVFDYQRNFLPHPIVNGWKSFHVDAATSLAGNGWTTVVETDDDSVPARRPMVLARSFGSGRVVAFGDSNTWADSLIGDLQNKLFGVRCAEWLLFRI